MVNGLGSEECAAPPSGFKSHFVLEDGGRPQTTFLRTTGGPWPMSLVHGVRKNRIPTVIFTTTCHVCTVTYNFRAFEL
jgi:hypothetical protein